MKSYKKYSVIILLFVLPMIGMSQERDSIVVEKRVKGFAGIDVFSALNSYSIIGGIEVGKSRFWISASHVWGSSRIGVHYSYYLWKKYKVLEGVGFHNSFLLYEYNMSRPEYDSLLKKEERDIKESVFAILPNYSEVRHQYLFTISLDKEFKLYKGLYTNLRVKGVYCINPFYKKQGFGPMYGIQFYYKWC